MRTVTSFDEVANYEAVLAVSARHAFRGEWQKLDPTEYPTVSRVFHVVCARRARSIARSGDPVVRWRGGEVHGVLWDPLRRACWRGE